MAKNIVFALLFSVLLSSVNTAWTTYDKATSADGMYPQCPATGSDQRLLATNTLTDVTGLTAGTNYPAVIQGLNYVSYIPTGNDGLGDVADAIYSISGSTIKIGVTQSTGLLTESYNEQTATATANPTVKLFMQGVLITEEGGKYYAYVAFLSGAILRNELGFPTGVTTYVSFKGLSVARGTVSTIVNAYVGTTTTATRFVAWTLSTTAEDVRPATDVGLNWGTAIGNLLAGDVALPTPSQVFGTQNLFYLSSKKVLYARSFGDVFSTISTISTLTDLPAFLTASTIGASTTDTNIQSAQLLNGLSVLSVRETAATKIHTVAYRPSATAWSDATNYFQTTYATERPYFYTDNIQSVVIVGDLIGQINWVKYDATTGFTRATEPTASQDDVSQIAFANQVRISGNYLFALQATTLNIYHRRNLGVISKVRQITGLANLVTPTAAINLYRVSIPCQCLTGTTSSAAWALRRFSCFSSTLKCIATVVQTSSASTPTWGAC